MGGQTYASNTVEAGISVAVNAIIESTQICQSRVLQSNDLNIVGNRGSVINIGAIDWSQVISLNETCSQSAQSSLSIDNTLDQTIKQIAAATSQAFEASVNSTDAQNISESWERIGEKIKIAYTQTCQELLVQQNTANISDSVSSRITLASLNWSQSTDSVVNCVQKTAAVVDLKNKLVQDIEQKATATVESLLGGLIGIIIIIIIIIAVVVLGGGKTLTNPKFIIPLVALIGAYLGLAAWQKWFPFR